MSKLELILKNSYPVIILSIVSYIFFQIINRIKNKKKINFTHEISIILFIIYLLVLFNIVTYPLNEYGKNNFNFFQELFRYKIGSPLFMQNIIGNIVLFIPLGMFLYFYFKLKFIPFIITTIFYSLIIETTQLIIGRVFDIDDIILNLIGSLIGFYFSKYSK